MRAVWVVVALASSAVGCVDVTASSRSYLSEQDSGARVAGTTYDVAGEVTRLLSERGFALVDQHATAPSGTVAMTFGEPAYGWTSVFHVWVTPLGPRTSHVAILGKPAWDGRESCSAVTVALPCTHFTALRGDALYALNGRREAEVVHGVLSELALEGLVYGPGIVHPRAPAPPPIAAPSPIASNAPGAPSAADVACEQTREAIETRAAAIADPFARDELLHTAPVCD